MLLREENARESLYKSRGGGRPKERGRGKRSTIHRIDLGGQLDTLCKSIINQNHHGEDSLLLRLPPTNLLYHLIFLYSTGTGQVAGLFLTSGLDVPVLLRHTWY